MIDLGYFKQLVSFKKYSDMKVTAGLLIDLFIIV